MKNKKYYYNIGDKVKYTGDNLSTKEGYIKDIYIKDFETGPKFLLSTNMEGEVWVTEKRLNGVIPRANEMTYIWG